MTKLSNYLEISRQGLKMTAAEIAADHGCTRSAVYKKAAAQGWTYVSCYERKLPPAVELRKLLKKEPNLTSVDLQTRFGVDASTVSVRCRAAGIKLKRKPYARRQEARS